MLTDQEDTGSASSGTAGSNQESLTGTSGGHMGGSNGGSAGGTGQDGMAVRTGKSDGDTANNELEQPIGSG